MKLHNILKIIVTVAAIFAVILPASAEIMNIDPMSSVYVQSKLTKDSTISCARYNPWDYDIDMIDIADPPEIADSDSAEIIDVDPMSSVYLQFKLKKDSTISYTWYCDDTLDFYIADSTGNKYMVYNDVQGLTGEFTVPYDSTWYIMWSNNNTTFPVSLTHDVSTSIPSPSISMICIIAIAIIVALMLRRKRRQQRGHSRRYNKG